MPGRRPECEVCHIIWRGWGYNRRRMNNNKLSLLQISDFHLFSDPRAELMGLNTHDSLDSVLSHIRSGNRKPDLIIASGDLVHDGSSAGYQRMEKMLGSLPAPVYCMPGNHDDKQRLRDLLGRQCSERHNVCAPNRVDLDGWRLILLDTVVNGEKYGHISTQELHRLEQELDSAADRQILIFLHHQPVPAGSAWLDSMQVKNAEALFDIVDSFSPVRAIAWGHVHQAFEGERNGVRLFSTPSTCIQFAPASERFALDQTPPGWRWFELGPDGRLDSDVERLQTLPQCDHSAEDAQGYS